MTGLEPTASWSLTKRSTKLNYTPILFYIYLLLGKISRVGLEPTSPTYVSVLTIKLTRLAYTNRPLMYAHSFFYALIIAFSNVRVLIIQIIRGYKNNRKLDRWDSNPHILPSKGSWLPITSTTHYCIKKTFCYRNKRFNKSNTLSKYLHIYFISMYFVLSLLY